MNLKCLTLAQPWPAAFELGKRVENRDWKPSISQTTGWIALHGGKAKSPKNVGVMQDWAFIRRAAPAAPREPKVIEGVFALCQIERVVHGGTIHALPLDQIRWYFGPYGWVLNDFVFLPKPIPARGMLGLWTPDRVLSREILLAYRETITSQSGGRV